MTTVAERLSSAPRFAETDGLVENLRNQKNRILPYLGFLAGSVDNPNQKKIDQSFSGNALNPLINGSAQLVVMGICRIFDEKNPLLVKALEATQEVSDELEQQRKSAHNDWGDSWLQLGQLATEINRTKERAENFYQSDLYARIRVFRTEDLAHADAYPSRDREKFNLGHEKIKISLEEVISAATDTIEIVDSLISHWRFHIEDSHQSLDIRIRYTKCFWDALPNFSKEENSKLVFE
ncbi:MAG: hypothetical protein QNJ03_03975 [Dinoroseobacter sp.]|nr:hypothetical protein [Dinoroseobacter sp.]